VDFPVQGFQCIVDDSGGFSAVATGLLTTLSDEYPRLPRLTFAVRPPTVPRPASALNAAASADNPLARALHDAVSLGALSDASSLYIVAGEGDFQLRLMLHSVLSLVWIPSGAFEQSSAICSTHFNVFATLIWSFLGWIA
jgi:hypothetical protein